MNSIYEKNNVAHISGKVAEEPQFSHLILGEGFYNLKLEVPRLSLESDTIPVTISERLIDNVQVGDELSIDGEFRSYNRFSEGKSRLILTLFAKELTDFDDERNSNIISLTGYICKEPIYRTTPFGREICDCLVAVNRAYNKSDYIPCIAWGRNARFIKSLGVGVKISLIGRIQSRKYQKKIDDEKFENRVAYEISIASVSLAGEDEDICSDNNY